MKAGHRFLLGAGAIVAAMAVLITQGVKETGVYFLTPTELAEKTAADSSFLNAGVKVGARVVPGSIRRDETSRQIDFVIGDGAHQIPVTYRGVLPDLFREGKGVVTQGRLGADGMFVASEVLAKHDENYMPPEVAKALKDSGQWKDGKK